MLLTEEDFKSVIKNTVLCSIDLVVKTENNKILLGLRRNRPAQGFWFVPGGRVLKSETLHQALARISKSELGVELLVKDVELLGLYDHIYPDNFFNDESFGTHYVVTGLRVKNKVSLKSLPKEQHDDFCEMSVEELLKCSKVHENSKAYFYPNAACSFIVN